MKVLAALAVLIMLSGAAMAQRVGPEYHQVDGGEAVIINSAAGSSFTPTLQAYLYSTDGAFTVSGWVWDAARTDFTKAFPTFGVGNDSAAYSLADMILPVNGKVDMLYVAGVAGTETVHIVWYK